MATSGSRPPPRREAVPHLSSPLGQTPSPRSRTRWPTHCARSSSASSSPIAASWPPKSIPCCNPGPLWPRKADALRQVLIREQLAHRGVVAAEVDTMLQPVTIVAARGVQHEEHESAEISVSVFFFVMYLVIMLYGMNVARSIITVSFNSSAFFDAEELK